jgi:hypothetical protein
MSDELMGGDDINSIMNNIRIMKETSDKIKAKLDTEKNPVLKEQAKRNYSSLDSLVSIFGSLLDETTNLEEGE